MAGGEGGDRVRWLDGIIDSMDMNVSKLGETVKDRGAWLQSTGSLRVRHNLATGQQLQGHILKRSLLVLHTPGCKVRVPASFGHAGKDKIRQLKQARQKESRAELPTPALRKSPVYGK